MIPTSRSITVIIALCFMAIFLNLPYAWVIFVPIILGWLVVSLFIAVFIAPFVDEWLEKYRE